MVGLGWEHANVVRVQCWGFPVNARYQNGVANTNIECRHQAMYWDAEPSFVWVNILGVNTLARIRVCPSLSLEHIALVKVFPREITFSFLPGSPAHPFFLDMSSTSSK